MKNEWITCTHRVWSPVKRKTGATLTSSRAVRVTRSADFQPIKLDARFRIGAEKGLIAINQLFEGEILKSFTQLQDKYGLCPKEVYLYLQLRDYIMCCTSN